MGYLKKVSNVEDQSTRERLHVHPFSPMHHLQTPYLIWQQNGQHTRVCMIRKAHRQVGLRTIWVEHPSKYPGFEQRQFLQPLRIQSQPFRQQPRHYLPKLHCMLVPCCNFAAVHGWNPIRWWRHSRRRQPHGDVIVPGCCLGPKLRSSKN